MLKVKSHADYPPDEGRYLRGKAEELMARLRGRSGSKRSQGDGDDEGVSRDGYLVSDRIPNWIRRPDIMYPCGDAASRPLAR